jgi:hypothetical protein
MKSKMQAQNTDIIQAREVFPRHFSLVLMLFIFVFLLSLIYPIPTFARRLPPLPPLPR